MTNHNKAAIPHEMAALLDGFDLQGYLGDTAKAFPHQQAGNRRVRTTHRVGSSLQGIGPTFRRRIRMAFGRLGGRCRPLNDDLRARLAEALFQIEDDLEHRQPRHPQVRLLRTARNRLYDDMGWNECPRHATPITA